MCYNDIYQCDVSCFNSELNITSALNGTIEAVGPLGQYCHVDSCKFIERISDLGLNVIQNPPETLPIGVWFILGVGLVIVAIAIIYLRKV